MKVANELDRNCIGIELDEGYLEMIKGKVGFNGDDFEVVYHSHPQKNPMDITEVLETYEEYDWEKEVDRFFGDKWERELDAFFGNMVVN